MLKRFLFLITAAVLLLCMACTALAESTIAYDDLPQAHRTLYDKAMATALADVQKRIPGKNMLKAMARGDFSGYTDQKSENSLQVDYRVSDSVVKVGEKIRFYVNVSCDYTPMIYTVSGLVFDERFAQTGSLNSSGTSTRVDDTFKAVTFSYTPTVPGYVNFVFAVSDGNGNQVSVVTSTVMVCEEDDPIFQNQSVDINADAEGNLGLMLSLDRAKLSVGTVITATADITTRTDPVRYRGVWTLTDDAGNILDTLETTSEVNAQAEQARVTFEYRPLQAGKLQFLINANDGEGNRIKTNTPVIAVDDGYYLTARLNPASAAMAGSSLTATYHIHGHECEQACYSVTWTCSDAEGNALASSTQTVSERSGQIAYTPRIGQEVEFRVDAMCEHFPDAYPATAWVALIGGEEDGLCGDADGNGQVNVQDALLILQHDAGWSVRINSDNADVDGSGSVNRLDAVEILRGAADGTLQ
ncbi:MAG: dockerin type I repeat-containing protein [Clostridia bacterium]|nr:dockerin type I repeat-containing protein [Clostridia bacterium]